MLKEFNVVTKDRYQLIDITDQVEEIIKESKIKHGLALIFVLHSTAGIFLTENEPGLRQDWLQVFKKMISGYNFLRVNRTGKIFDCGKRQIDPRDLATDFFG